MKSLNIFCFHPSLQQSILFWLNRMQGLICRHSVGGSKLSNLISSGEVKTQEISKCFHKIHRCGERTARFTSKYTLWNQSQHSPIQMSHLCLSFGIRIKTDWCWCSLLGWSTLEEVRWSRRNHSCSETCGFYFSFYYRKHQSHSRPPCPLPPGLAAGHSQAISHHLELIVLFLYLCKNKFHLFCVENYKWERGILSSTSTVSIPNWSVHCFTVARTLRSRWSTASRWGSESTGEMGSWAMADFKADFSTPFFKEFSLFQVETRMLEEKV